MFTAQNMGPFALMAATVVIAAFFVYRNSARPQSYLLAWSLGWATLALHYLAAGLEPLATPRIFLAISLLALAATAMIFFSAAQQYAGATAWSNWLTTAVAMLALWTAAYSLGNFPYSPEYGFAAVLVASAWVFWRASVGRETTYDRLLAGLFLIWGMVLVALARFAPAGTPLGRAFLVPAGAPVFFGAVLMAAAVTEREKQDAEREIRASASARRSEELRVLEEIAQAASAALEPEALFVKIQQALESAGETLAFEHIGIGVLDYAAKEIVIQAEAGPRRGAMGRRLALETHLVGAVARTGQWSAVGDLAAEDRMRPVLDDSASAVALPLFDADQVHGVIYVETVGAADFSAEQVQLLRTLADLISGALRNALAFEKARAEAVADPLTGLKTHRFLLEALAAEWKRSTRASRSFSLALFDLDHFKGLNDFHGRAEGDAGLQRVAEVLRQNCRSSDVVARYGGDEFIVLMPETTAEQGYDLAEKLRARIENEAMLREKNTTASVGVAEFPTHGGTPQDLIQAAEASMYLAKHQGGNTVVSAAECDPAKPKKWKQDVLEAYLGVTLKRLFSTGPEAFRDIQGRLAQFSRSLAGESNAPGASGDANPTSGAAKAAIPPAVRETVTSLALAIDSKDHYTQGHSQKVAGYAVLIARRLRLDEPEVEHVHLGGLLHDIGKVGIPAHILNKSGPLNPQEWAVMKEHVVLGDKLLDPLEALDWVRPMIRHHHEMYDGSGYPDRLSGDQIPLGARIIAIADAFDTILTERAYKKARTRAAALAEIERCAGAQFDPALVRLFVEALQQTVPPAAETATDAASTVTR